MHASADAPTYVVPDTSVHLHGLPFTDLDWRALTGAPRVVVVVPRQVLRELDEKKDEHRLQHMKDRARAAIALVRAYRATATAAPELRPGVTLVYDPTSPTGADLAALRLDPDRADDVILGAAAAWRDAHGEGRTLLLTRDGGMEFGAAELGLEVMLLPPELERPAERDPRDAELAELRRKLAQHEARLPRLRTHLGDGRVHLPALVRLPEVRPDASVEGIVAQALAKHPPRDRQADAAREAAGTANAIANARPSDGRTLGDLLPELARMSFVPPEEEYARYERERQQYAENVRRYLAAEEAYRLRIGLVVPVSVVVENAGTAPASDVRLTLTFPPGLRVETEETRPGPPAPPPDPRPPRAFLTNPDFGALDSYVPRPTASEAERRRQGLGGIVAITPPWAPHIEATADGTVVTQTWRKIQQADQEATPALLVTFASASLIRPFSLRYELRADHVPVEQGELHIVARVATPS